MGFLVMDFVLCYCYNLSGWEHRCFHGHFIHCGGGLQVRVSALAGVVSVVVFLIQYFILASVVGVQYYT